MTRILYVCVVVISMLLLMMVDTVVVATTKPTTLDRSYEQYGDDDDAMMATNMLELSSTATGRKGRQSLKADSDAAAKLAVQNMIQNVKRRGGCTCEHFGKKIKKTFCKMTPELAKKFLPVAKAVQRGCRPCIAPGYRLGIGAPGDLAICILSVMRGFAKVTDVPGNVRDDVKGGFVSELSELEYPSGKAIRKAAKSALKKGDDDDDDDDEEDDKKKKKKKEEDDDDDFFLQLKLFGRKGRKSGLYFKNFARECLAENRRCEATRKKVARKAKSKEAKRRASLSPKQKRREKKMLRRMKKIAKTQKKQAVKLEKAAAKQEAKNDAILEKAQEKESKKLNAKAEGYQECVKACPKVKAGKPETAAANAKCGRKCKKKHGGATKSSKRRRRRGGRKRRRGKKKRWKKRRKKKKDDDDEEEEEDDEKDL